MTSSNNIIQFPNNQQSRIDEVSIGLLDHVLTYLSHHDYELTKLNIKDIGLIIEATKSLVLRYEEKPHPFQKYADDNFEENELGVYLKNNDPS